jgi:protein ImuB
MRWLAVDLPGLGLAVHTRGLPPGSAERALALVVEGRVLAVNALSENDGVTPGQRTASALALCPALRFLEYLPEEESRLLRQMAEACLAVTPTVVLSPPHTLLLEVGGCLQLFRGMAGLLRQLRRSLKPFALEYLLAQAPTPRAALALVQSPQAADSFAIESDAMADYLPLLRAVPVDALPWPEAMRARLATLHFHTLGEVLALPRAALGKRLGAAAMRELCLLLGELPDPRQPITAAEDFQATLHFLDGISHVEGLRFPMKRLLDDFCRFLRQRQFSCARFHWRFTHQDKSRQQLTIASARGEPQAARFMTLSELKLEHFRISAPVDSITLLAQEFQPQTDTRLSLLPDPGQQDTQALELLDRLRARLGADACQPLAVHNTHRPEAAQTVGGKAESVPEIATGWRPFWLWPEAKSLRHIDGRLWWQGAFTLLSGPERIVLPWWEDGDTRDYYLARHDNGAHYWLYFSAQAQGWFCQGLSG